MARAFSGGGLGKEEDQARPRRMARIEDRSVLLSGGSRPHRRRTRSSLREGGGAVAGRADGVWAAPELGGRARRFGASQRDSGVSRWELVDLEFGGGSLVA